MAEPFVFHFRGGANGHPEVMYIADLRCQCGLCMHEQYQRYYHATPFHTLTLKKLNQLAAAVYEKVDYECENCGSQVLPEHVLNTALTYGFADDAGVIRIYVDRQNDSLVAPKYWLMPSRRLDPQEHPQWAPDTEKGHIFDTLTEELIEDIFDRPLNAKVAWRELLEDWLDDPEDGAYTRVCKGLWVIADANEEAAANLSEEIPEEEFFKQYDNGDFAVINLHDCVPTQLPTYRHPEKMAGRWQTWLDADIQDALADNTLWVEAYLSHQIVIDIIKRTFDTARLTYQFHKTDADAFFSEITTPGEGVYGRGLPISSVLKRAVYTGLTPGEAARLTAEEICGVLLRVWKSSD